MERSACRCGSTVHFQNVVTTVPDGHSPITTFNGRAKYQIRRCALMSTARRTVHSPSYITPICSRPSSIGLFTPCLSLLPQRHPHSSESFGGVLINHLTTHVTLGTARIDDPANLVPFDHIFPDLDRLGHVTRVAYPPVAIQDVRHESKIDQTRGSQVTEYPFIPLVLVSLRHAHFL